MKPTTPAQSRCLACGTTKRLGELIAKKNGALETFLLCTHHMAPVADFLRNSGKADATFQPDPDWTAAFLATRAKPPRRS